MDEIPSDHIIFITARDSVRVGHRFISEFANRAHSPMVMASPRAATLRIVNLSVGLECLTMKVMSRAMSST